MTVSSISAARSNRDGLFRAARNWIGKARYHSRPAVEHVQEYGYTMAGGAAFTVAGFVHSTFTGFIVMGVAFIMLEFRVRGK